MGVQVMYGTLPTFARPPVGTPPYWACCDVYGGPGDTVCWACVETTEPSPKRPHLHESAPCVGRSEFPADLPEVDRLIDHNLQRRSTA